MLSVGAFNAFLKILEEPPPHVVFILATTEIHKLPATIISRCQRFDFYRIPPENISQRIKYICEKENIEIDDESANLISICADGAMRDALSILDQCVNICHGKIDESSTKKILGISGTEYLSEIYNNIKQSNSKECIQIIDKMYSESKSMIRLCEEITEYFRNLMAFKITERDENSLFKDIDISELNLDRILFSLDVLQESYKNMIAGVNNKIEMEIALVKICENISINKSLTNSQQIQNTKKEELESNFSVTTNLNFDENSENLLNCWKEILKNLSREPSLKSLYTSLKNSKAYLKGDYVLIESENDLSFELLRQSKYRTEIKKIVKDITGKQYKLGPYKKESTIDDKKDPLDELIQTAKSGGVNIILK